MGKYLFPIFSLALLVLFEIYTWQAIKLLSKGKYKFIKWIYLAFNASLYLLFIYYKIAGPESIAKTIVTYNGLFFFVLLIGKLIITLFFAVNDFYRIIRFLFTKMKSTGEPKGKLISRSEFLSKIAMGVAAIPMISLIHGVFINAYNYQFHRVKLKFPNLPDAFDGFTIIQLSDIHSGSFNETKPIIEVIRKINKLNADLILFTGDLVNNITDEMLPFMDIFNKLQAKHGVMSVTGNHDYGDYVEWPTPEAKKDNFNRFIETHQKLGWNLLINENRLIEKNGQKIAIIGIENWGKALRFPRYGKMGLAIKGTEDIPFKILLSHDPSHWDAQVRPLYKDIDLTLSGHTHGFQFGIESKYVKFSPSQWVYKQWAGLYQAGKQYLYVNRGFGFLGYPGRVGILPEVTIIELKKA